MHRGKVTFGSQLYQEMMCPNHRFMPKACGISYTTWDGFDLV